MSKVTASSDMSNIDPKEMPRYVDICLSDIIAVMNGKLDFQSNFNAKEVSVVFSAADTDTAVTHSLGRIATRYIVTSSTGGLVLYTGATAGSSSTMYLKSSATGTVTVLIY